MLNRKDQPHSFEEAGNYVYSISPREIQKYALGLQYDFIAYKVQQDHYEKGVEFENLSEKSKFFQKIKRRIILKATPKQQLIEDLKKKGYVVEILPKNPYLKGNST